LYEISGSKKKKIHFDHKSEWQKIYHLLKKYMGDLSPPSELPWNAKLDPRENQFI
jgi:hypothetical protein